jgi:hypothetical protein
LTSQPHGEVSVRKAAAEEEVPNVFRSQASTLTVSGGRAADESRAPLLSCTH